MVRTLPVAYRSMAAEAGYRPDPELGRLMTHLRRARTEGVRAALAYLCPPRPVRGSGPLDFESLVFDGARGRARELGYDLQRFAVGPGALARARLAGILGARGIVGMVLGPWAAPGARLRLPWQGFSAVSVGQSVAEPVFHRVAPDHFRAAATAVARLAGLGYRRIGLALTRRMSDRVAGLWLGGFLSAQQERGGAGLPPLLADELDTAAVGVWMRRTRADAVICPFPWLAAQLRETGWRIPERIGFVALCDVDPDGDLSGIDQRPAAIGRAVADVLDGLLQRNERGVPTEPRVTLVPGRWVEGRTVLPQAAGGSRATPSAPRSAGRSG